jgi:RNA polymerase sigma factor (sigma-70 family)
MTDEPRSPSPAPLDPKALARLVESHRDFLRFLERRVGSRAVAEDLLQAAFVRAAEKGGALRDGEALIGWFYRVLRNAVIDHGRRRATADRAVTALAAELVDVEEPPEAWREVACRCVLQLAANLKPEYAEALARVEVDGQAVKDFAAERGLAPNTASVRLKRAREALRREVAASCGTCAEHGCLDCACGGPATDPR